MHKKIILTIMVISLFIAWTNRSNTNTAICTAGNEQKIPQLAADGSGGAVITWEDSRSGGDSDIYAQLIDGDGVRRWRRGGTSLCGAVGPQRHPKLTADGAGGFIVTWYDRRGGKNYDIYAQRIDASGRNQWTADGIPVCTAVGDQYDPIPVADGEGGVIIIWQDRRGGDNYDIYAQRVDVNGRVKWDADGVAVCSAKEDQEHPRPVSDGNGGVIISWQDRRSGGHYDIYAQRINSSGTVQWTADGNGVCVAANDQRRPQITADGNGGALMTWQDKRNGSDYDIYSQKIDAGGRAQWTIDGIAVCSAPNNQYDPSLASDGNGGAILTWQDYRKGAACSFDAFAEETDLAAPVCDEKQLNDWNIYAQRVNGSGKVQWAANGVAICTANVDQYKPQVIADGNGGVIVVWRASDKENDHNIYAQRMSVTGRASWPAKGVAITTAPGNQVGALLAPDGNGGAIVTWYDKRRGHSDIYVQKICPTGRIGQCL